MGDEETTAEKQKKNKWLLLLNECNIAFMKSYITGANVCGKKSSSNKCPVDGNSGLTAVNVVLLLLLSSFSPKKTRDDGL